MTLCLSLDSFLLFLFLSFSFFLSFFPFLPFITQCFSKEINVVPYRDICLADLILLKENNRKTILGKREPLILANFHSLTNGQWTYWHIPKYRGIDEYFFPSVSHKNARMFHMIHRLGKWLVWVIAGGSGNTQTGLLRISWVPKHNTYATNIHLTCVKSKHFSELRCYCEMISTCLISDWRWTWLIEAVVW